MAYLYVIRAPGGARKVGYSRDPETRRRSLSTTGYVCTLEHFAECPDGLTRAAEKHAHALLWDGHLQSEWFAADPDAARAAVDAAIAAALAGEPMRRPPGTGRFEFRFDEETTGKQLDYLRRLEPDVPSRAEMVRRIVDRVC